MDNYDRSTPITKPKYLLIFFQILIASVFLLIIFLLRPVKRIYIAPLQTSRIGHFVTDTEILLACIHTDQLKAKKIFFIVWIAESFISNEYVYSIWKQKINVVKNNVLTEAILVSAIYVEKLLKFKLTYRFVDWDGYLPYVHLLQETPTVFSMLEKDEEECIRILESNGIDLTKKWVCILNRDEVYLERTFNNLQWSYNNYRNSDINTYRLAADYLAEKNIITMRMGSKYTKTFSSDKSKLVIDYANASWKSPKLDIYLASKCLFFLSSGTGLDAVAVAMRKPLVLVNLAQPLHLLRSKHKHIFITKYFYSKDKKHFLNFNDYYQLGIKSGFTIDNPRHLRAQDLTRLNIETIDNSEIEIKDAVAEMYESMTEGNLNKLELDNDQLCFWQSFPRDKRLDNCGPPLARIGKRFLEQNLWLLC